MKQHRLDHQPELLDIEQAAAFLRVSETSLRRWTNAGRLRCFRIGGRRERRFRRVDLMAFLEGSSAAEGAALRGAGSAAAAPEARAESERHDPATGHLFGLYTSDLARVRSAVEFLDRVDPRREVSFLLAAPDVRDRVFALLERRLPSLREDIRTARLVVSEYAESAAAQLEFWHNRFVAALRAGARSLRVVGDVSGGPLAGRNPFEKVFAYDVDYDRSFTRRFPVSTLCLYDARRLSGVDAAGLLRCHDEAFRHPGERFID